MISLKEWAMAKILQEQGVSKTEIARRLGIDRKTVGRALQREEAPIYSRSQRPSKLDPYKEYIQRRLERYERLSATKLYLEIQERGYQGSYETVKRYVAAIRPRPRQEEAFCRFETGPGEQTQVDWGEFGTIWHQGRRRKLFCFCLVLGYSRADYIEFTVSRDLQTFLSCHLHAWEYLGGVTCEILYDQLKTVVLSQEGEHTEWNPKFLDFARQYGFLPRLCAPGRKETKGKVEALVRYVRSSFFAGLEFTDLDDLNAKARNWLDSVANVRLHGTHKKRPIDLLPQEGLQPLAGRCYPLPVRERRKVHKDCQVYFQANRYSVPFQYAGREVEVEAAGTQLRIFYAGELIAIHEITPLKGQMVMREEHFADLPRPPERSSMKAVKQEFLSTFPGMEGYLEGLVATKFGNAKYHLIHILGLLELYPHQVVAQALAQAASYGAYGVKYVRNICRQASVRQLEPLPSPVSLARRPTLLEEAVEERSLSEYALLAERVGPHSGGKGGSHELT